MSLSIWTVYDKPADFPTMFVARRWVVVGPVPHATDDVVFAYNLERLRDQLPPGLVRLPPSPGDDPVIVESWI